MDAFSSLTAEALGWYVYLLSDPGDGQVFYVGKGVRSRAFDHAMDARANADPEELQSAKIRRIRQIEASGSHVGVRVLRHGLASEKLAYEVEAAAIDLVNAMAPGTLLNVVLGHHHAQRGLMSAEELEILYAARPAPRVEVPVMLVSLNRLWTPSMSDGDLYEFTRGWWRVSEDRARRVRYVMGVHNGVVRSVYRPVTWRARTVGDRDYEQDEGRRPRWAFEGEPAPEMAPFLRTSVSRFLVQQWSHLYVAPEGEPPSSSGERAVLPDARSVAAAEGSHVLAAVTARLHPPQPAPEAPVNLAKCARVARSLSDLPVDIPLDASPDGMAAVGAAVERLCGASTVDDGLLAHLVTLVTVHPATPSGSRQRMRDLAARLRDRLKGGPVEELLSAGMAYGIRLDSLGPLGAVWNTPPSMVGALARTGPGLRRVAYEYLAQAVASVGDLEDQAFVRQVADRERMHVQGAWGSILGSPR
ncbi:LEM-3-like GIY-YIG domain-containing protein [Cellulomonas carbonis]|uniref:GIY-YIG domain-containing protein n=1 Tax=Cellulomonas carbonis T26 TaxID=947969 RepID=A0A0A0BVV0_9CELL|nr:hypothetical protein [Cellulomonas carbonis]KGM11254.1 hypothetical protein N868_11230 [Cellulomonas carbonis T26]GGC18217.1 hypothetical protein GCM10010972_34290 [Cellulomonas carbonis]